MKILYVITKAVVGGAQTSVLNLAREMKMRGHEVFVGFGDGDWLPEELSKEKIPYFRFDFLKRTHNPFSSLLFVFEIRKYLREHDFDVVHFNSSNSLSGAMGVKLSGRKTKTVFTFRGMSMLDEHYEISRLLKFFYKLFFKFFLLFVDSPVFVSQENLDKFGCGQVASNGVLIYNGLNLVKMNFFSSEDSRKFFTKKVSVRSEDFFKDKYIIGSIGRLDYQKNYEFLIKIFHDILKIRPNSVAVIIGEGAERASYEKLIKENNLSDNIFLLGDIPNAYQYIKGFDLFVQPSRYEGLSITLIEAIFAGLPILASDVGGNRETVSDISLEIYQLDDREEFFEKFKLLQTEDVLNKIRQGNVSQAQKFDLKNTVLGYENVYKE